MNTYGMSQITHTHRTNTAKNSNTCAKNSRTYVHNHASCNAGSSGPAGPQHECGLARLLHDTNSNNKQDKPHAHIAQTPRKTRRTGGITRAYTLKIKFSALRGTRGQRAKSTVMVPRNPAFRQKAPGIRGGVWGEAPRFFLFFLFFSCKNHLIQVKDSQ